jgi:hypothetical protein
MMASFFLTLNDSISQEAKASAGKPKIIFWCSIIVNSRQLPVASDLMIGLDSGVSSYIVFY